MKYILTLTLLLTATAAHAQSGTNPNYDQALAEQLGADNYGMKSYYLVILKTGPNTTADADLTRASFRGHLDNINRLADEGKLIVAGPLGQNARSYRGIFILNNGGCGETDRRGSVRPKRPLLPRDLHPEQLHLLGRSKRAAAYGSGHRERIAGLRDIQLVRIGGIANLFAKRG